MTKHSDSSKIRVLLVDDHVAVRMGLRMAIDDADDMRVVAESDDGDAAVEAYRTHKPDVTILDLRMQGVDGLKATRLMKAEFPSARILIYSSFARGEEAFQVLNAGASGFVIKEMALDRLLEAIRIIHGGEKYIPPQIAARVGERVIANLSPREMEVLNFVARGLSNKEIAARLGLVVGTVKLHMVSIFNKLGVSDRTQALVTAVRRGIIAID
ncbi:MAG TPA: response regulator transcription factor [Opitutaceae bacterium]